jgi:peptidoglycan/LPS O-acetylase OafA/YrhL
VAILICQLIVQSSNRQWKWLDSRTAGYLGKISYPLYLYHMLATHVAIRIAAHIPTQSPAVFVATALLVAIAIASCSYYIVEKPFLAIKEKQSASAAKERIPFVPPKEDEGSAASVSPAC